MLLLEHSLLCIAVEIYPQDCEKRNGYAAAHADYRKLRSAVEHLFKGEHRLLCVACRRVL